MSRSEPYMPGTLVLFKEGRWRPATPAEEAYYATLTLRCPGCGLLHPETSRGFDCGRCGAWLLPR